MLTWLSGQGFLPRLVCAVFAILKMGLIKSYHARVDAAALGFPVTVFTAVKLAAVGEGELKKFEEWLEKWPMVARLI